MYKLYGNDKNFEIDKKVRLTGLYGVNGTQNTTKCLGSPENRRIGTVKKQISQGYRRHKSWEIECNDGDTNEYNSNNLSAVTLPLQACWHRATLSTVPAQGASTGERSVARFPHRWIRANWSPRTHGRRICGEACTPVLARTLARQPDLLCSPGGLPSRIHFP